MYKKVIKGYKNMKGIDRVKAQHFPRIDEPHRYEYIGLRQKRKDLIGT